MDEDPLKRHREIEKYLRKEKKEFDRESQERKLIVVGTSDSGKSTFIKQLKLLHGNGFNNEEKDAMKKQVYRNVIATVRLLFTLTELEEHLHEFVSLKEYVSCITPDASVDTNILQEVKKMWDKPEVQKALYLNPEKGFQDSIPYFMDRLASIFDSAYILSNEVTENISHHVFNCKNSRLHFFDVSGLRDHRKAWIPFFDHVTSIVFIASLSCYDQVMAEDMSTNRMKDALKEFENIATNKLLAKQQIILFLNKIDLFKKKIDSSPINRYFSDYEGTKGSTTLGVNYFRKKFLAKVPSEKATSVRCHITCCTDSKNMKTIIRDVFDFIIVQNVTSVNL